MKASVELTSDRGWKYGTRPIREVERVLVLLTVPGRGTVAVFSGSASSLSLAVSIYDHLCAALSEKG